MRLSTRTLCLERIVDKVAREQTLPGEAVEAAKRLLGGGDLAVA